jgi:ferredoxin
MYRQDRAFGISAQLNALAAQLQRLQERLQQVRSVFPPASRPRPSSVARVPTSLRPAGSRSTRTGVSHVTVAAELCLGCALCTRIAPGTFAIDSQTGTARVRDQGGDQAALIEMAVVRCPVGAIRYV